MDPGQEFLTQVGSDQFIVARVASAIYGFIGFEFGKFPRKMPNFSISLHLVQKK